jgi:hypothetical protein
MYRHDPQGTNRSQYSGPTAGVATVITSDSLWLDGSISIDEQNNLLVTTSGNTLSDLVIFDAAGVMMLNHRLVSGWTDENPCTPTISSEGRIYVTSMSSSDSKIHAIDFQGNVIWEYQVDDFVNQSLILDREGNLYFLTLDSRELISLTPDGTYRWSSTVPDRFHNLTSVGVFAPDGSQLYVAATENLYAISPEGSILWSYAVDPWVYFTMVDNDGNLYFCNPGDSSLTALTSTGDLIWQKHIAEFNLRRVRHWFTPTIDVYGNLYYSVEDRDRRRQLISLNALTVPCAGSWIFTATIWSAMPRATSIAPGIDPPPTRTPPSITKSGAFHRKGKYYGKLTCLLLPVAFFMNHRRSAAITSAIFWWRHISKVGLSEWNRGTKRYSIRSVSISLLWIPTFNTARQAGSLSYKFVRHPCRSDQRLPALPIPTVYTRG